MKQTWILFLAFIALAILYLFPLGRKDIWEPDQPRHALMSQEVLDRGFHLFQTHHGQHMPEYGPAYFWLSAVFSMPFAKVNDWTVVLPSTLSALGILLLLYFFGKTLGGERLGVFSAAILASTPNFFWQAQTALIDMPFALGVGLSIYVFYLAYGQEPSWKWDFALLVTLLFSWLVKGPVSVVLVGLPVVSYLCARQDWSGLWFWGKRFAIYTLLLSLIWFGGAYFLVGKDFFVDLIWKQTMGRFVNSVAHANPPYFYLKNFPSQFLPWILFLPFAWVAGGKKLREDPRFLFPLCWFVSIFVFFSAASGKRRDYLLPLFAAAALLIARGLEELLILAKETKPRQIAKWIGVTFCLFFAGVTAFSKPLLDLYRPELSQILLWTSFSLLPIALLAAYFFLKEKLLSAFAVMFVLIPLAASFICYQIFPWMSSRQSFQPLATQMLELVSPHSELIYFNSFRESFTLYGKGKLEGKKIGRREDLQMALQEGTQAKLLLVHEGHLKSIERELTQASLVLQRNVSGREHYLYLIKR